MSDNPGDEEWIVEPVSTSVDGDSDDRSENPFLTDSSDGRNRSQSDSDVSRSLKRTRTPFVVWFVMGVGALFVISGIGLVMFQTWFAQIAEPAASVVVEITQGTGRDDDGDRYTFYEAQTEFVTENGETGTYTHGIDPSEVKVGDTIDVLYDPNNPSLVVAKSGLWIWQWLMPAIFTVVGLVILAIMIPVRRFMRRARS